MTIRQKILLLALLVVPVFSGIGGTQTVSAADANNFKAGRIIDDAIFTNSNSMSVADIQAFLDSKMPNCDTYGTQRAGGGSLSMTNRQWIEQRYGISPPYRCVRDYRENPDTGANNYGTATNPAGSLSSAELISKYSAMFNISPKTLIVTLQKENGLITDNIPVPKNYSEAMGFGCPDNRPAGAPACDPAYGSFSTQLYQAARHFRGYMDKPVGWYVPYTVGWNTILWNPNGACGTSDVYIENAATAALYSYTPYRPNQAALTAQYGLGDGCSAYGNRNFYMYFTDWFGSTSGVSRDASIVSSTGSDGWLEFGQTRTVTVTVRNTGNDGWCADGSCPAGQLPTRLVSQSYAAYGAYDETDPAWVNSAQVKMQTPSVRPGETATFVFKVKAPYANGFAASNKFYVNIGGVGVTSFAESANLWIGTHAYAPPAPTLLSQSQQASTTVLGNQEVAATVTLRNNSQTIWYSDNNLAPGRKPFRLYTPGYAASPYFNKRDVRWLTPSQIAMKTPVVNPGETAVFEFALLGPLGASSSPLKLIPVIDGVSALQDVGISLNAVTQEPVLSYEYVSASFPPAQTRIGTVSTQNATVSLKNTSNTVWHSDASGYPKPTRIVTIFPIYRSSPFYSSTDTTNWLAPSQIAMKTATVNPGETAVFEFAWTAPSRPGDYLEYFSLVTDGYKFFPMYGSAWRTTVTN